MTESPGQSGLDACPVPAETGKSMFTIASQLIMQLVGLIEGPPGKFRSRIAVLRTIQEAWTSNREVTVRIEDSFPDQVAGHDDTSMGMTGYADRTLDYRDENGSSATGSVEMVTEDAPGGLLNTIEVFEDLGNRRARVNLRKIDIKTEGRDVLADKGEEEVCIPDSWSHSPQQSVEKERLLCKKCGKVFLLGERSPDRPFVCPCCQLGSSQQDTIQQVASISDNDRDGKSEAPACPVTSKSAVRTSNGLLECHVCSKGFKNRSHLKDHIRIHSKEKPYSCKYCGKCFGTVSNRNKHQSIHLRKPLPRGCQTSEGESGQNDSPSTPSPVAASSGMFGEPKASCGTLNSPTESSKRYLCDVCDVSFSSEAALDLHRRRHRFSCRTCGIVLPTRSDLMQHMKGHAHSPSKLGARDKNMSTNSMMAIRKKYVKLRKTKGAYPCPSCKKVLVTARGFQNHMEYHANAKPHSCKVCLKNFLTFSHLKKHLRIHSGEKPFACPLCPHKFTQRTHLVNHWQKVHKRGIFHCGHCRRVFLDSDKLIEHQHHDHGLRDLPPPRMIPVKPPKQERPFSCPECLKGFVRRSHMTRHRESIHKVLFQCGHCAKHFLNKAKLESHKMVHLLKSPGKNSNPEVRETRKMPFRKMPFRKMPSKTGIVQRTKKLFECPHCERKLTRKGSLIEHIRTHTNEKPLVCLECGKAFSHRVRFSLHKKTHQTSSLACRICDELFQTKTSLDTHLQNQHGVVTSNPAVEDSCLYIDVVSSSVNKTKTSEHPVEVHVPSPQKKACHRCKYCSELLASHQRLVSHEKLHTGNKPVWECHLCKKICSSLGFLNQHMIVHGKEKIVPRTNIQRLAAKNVKVARQKRVEMALSCQFCDMVFQNHSQLAVHERSHKEETPFPCDFCRATFKSRSALIGHQKKKHALEVTGCARPDSKIGQAEHDTSSNHFSGHQSSTLTRSPVRRVSNANTSPRSRLTGGKRNPVRLSALNQSGSPRLSSSRTSYSRQLTFESKRSSPQAVSTIRPANVAVKRSPCRPSPPVRSPSKSPRNPSREIASNVSDSDTNRKILQCKISGCGGLFISKELLAQHERQHDQVLTQTNSQKAKTGKASSVSPGASLTGAKKKKKPTPDRSLVDHQRVHTSEKPFPCECGGYFTSKSSLNYHKRFHCQSGREIIDS